MLKPFKRFLLYLYRKYILFRYKISKPGFISGYHPDCKTKLKDTRFGTYTYFCGLKNMKVGENVFIGNFSFIDGTYGLDIEEGVQIGFCTLVVIHSSHISIRIYGKEYTKQKIDEKIHQTGKVHIGKYTFIGPHCVIMPNTTIGKGCIVSAYSYVKGDFPNFSIIAGNPAKIIGDTRKLDAKYLENYPELKELYNEWSKE